MVDQIDLMQNPEILLCGNQNYHNIKCIEIILLHYYKSHSKLVNNQK